MNTKTIKTIVIAGGGTAGWMAAAACAKLLRRHRYQIKLIESDQIGTVGVGEATLPHLRFFNKRLGISEADFIKATNASFKAGIEFQNWGAIGDAYIHPFGDYGASIKKISFHHYWLKARELGLPHKLDEYSLAVKFCQAAKFDFPSDDLSSILSTYSYAYHIDSGLYAQFLRRYSERLGVQRYEGKIHSVETSSNTGEIERLVLEDSTQIDGDFFIDCSGFRSLLLGDALGVGFESWKHWLPCDRAIAAPTQNTGTLRPYTQAAAYEAGWQWRIPLQHRTGNGYVFSSDFISSETAERNFRERLNSAPLKEPIKLKFEAGKRACTWVKNCVAIGLSAGFLEPLESTSIYLIQIAITTLLELFPNQADESALALEFNRQLDLEYERVRDFLILHYHATQRSDTAFWHYVRTMNVPSSLEHKMALFKSRAYVSPYAHGLFLEPSWLAVYLGQGYMPDTFDPRVAAMPEHGLLSQLEKFRCRVNEAVESMASHQDTLETVMNDVHNENASTARMSLYGAHSA